MTFQIMLHHRRTRAVSYPITAIARVQGDTLLERQTYALGIIVPKPQHR